MMMQKKVQKIQRILNQLYPYPKIPLNHKNIYTFLIAVLLSAQCTDKKVNLITPLLFKKAQTPEQMIKLSVKNIFEIIRPCGLGPTKAKAILNLSHQLIDDYNGEVPKNFEGLESLPGVGHKTASVMMCQVFNKLAFPVDTHIHRCAKRWGLSTGKNVKKTEEDLKELFPKKSWQKLHLQIIYFAREYCPARQHHVKDCPICSWIQS